MKNYLTGSDAVDKLHKNGFTNDFQLYGNDLLWVQEKLFIRAGEFSILEYHKIYQPGAGKEELIIFGIVAPYHNIRGILLNHYRSYTDVVPPVIVKKLNELKASVGTPEPANHLAYQV